MARVASHAIAKRNRNMAEEYENDLSTTTGSLGSKYGLVKFTVRQILKRQGVKIRQEKRDGRLSDLKAISDGHRYLSHKLNVYMASRGLSVGQMAERLSMSDKRITRMLVAGYDPTLLELQRINEVVNVGLPVGLEAVKEEIAGRMS